MKFPEWAVVLSLIGVAVPATAAESWLEGRHYTLLSPAQPTNVAAGKVEVLEVFSYGCSGCNAFNPIVRQLQKVLPANAQMNYLPASWLAHEGWPMFQRAYLTAKSMGIAQRTHDAMYDAIWKTGELGIVDPATKALKKQLPTIEDAARFYARVAGIRAETFLSTARSFAIAAAMSSADQKIQVMGVEGTPTFIINGKYRVNHRSLTSNEQLFELIKFLVTKEGGK